LGPESHDPVGTGSLEPAPDVRTERDRLTIETHVIQALPANPSGKDLYPWQAEAAMRGCLGESYFEPTRGLPQ
jgi:hypothetical protein